MSLLEGMLGTKQREVQGLEIICQLISDAHLDKEDLDKIEMALSPQIRSAISAEEPLRINNAKERKRPL
jgi:hypothetical protein